MECNKNARHKIRECDDNKITLLSYLNFGIANSQWHLIAHVLVTE